MLSIDLFADTHHRNCKDERNLDDWSVTDETDKKTCKKNKKLKKRKSMRNPIG